MACQVALLWGLFPAEPAVLADNARYEEAGFHLASGQGLKLSFSTLADADVREWACSRHPDRCADGDLYPTAAYPPGYQLFVAAVYAVVGRDVRALLLVQCALHLLLQLLIESVAFRGLRRAGYLFVITVSAVYPFLARQAGMVMSDHLHAVLLFASVWAAFALSGKRARWAVVGLLFAAATLTRPYSLVALPALLLVGPIRRELFGRWREVGVFVLSAGLLFAAWAGRNAETFGRFIPFTTTGIGAGLYLNKTEWTVGSALEEGNAALIYRELFDVSGDITTWRGDKRLREAAFEWMLENPHLVLAALPKRIVRSWISLGYQGRGLHPAAVGSILFLGGLLLLGVLGMLQRPRGVWLYPLVVIVTYWAFLLHTPSEARRTLALRAPMLLFAGLAVDAFLDRRARRIAARRELPVDHELRPPPSGIEGSPDVLPHQPK